jgi:hypothetical protein
MPTDISVRFLDPRSRSGSGIGCKTLRQVDFITAPSITTPATAYFHRAMRSLRASATIVGFLRRPPLRWTRSWNQRARSLAGDVTRAKTPRPWSFAAGHCRLFQEWRYRGSWPKWARRQHDLSRPEATYPLLRNSTGDGKIIHESEDPKHPKAPRRRNHRPRGVCESLRYRGNVPLGGDGASSRSVRTR